MGPFSGGESHLSLTTRNPKTSRSDCRSSEIAQQKRSTLDPTPNPQPPTPNPQPPTPNPQPPTPNPQPPTPNPQPPTPNPQPPTPNPQPPTPNPQPPTLNPQPSTPPTLNPQPPTPNPQPPTPSPPKPSTHLAFGANFPNFSQSFPKQGAHAWWVSAKVAKRLQRSHAGRAVCGLRAEPHVALSCGVAHTQSLSMYK